MSIELDIKVGDVVLGGKFKNKRIVVKTIGKDDLGQPTINGMSLLKMRIEKLLPAEKQSKETREESSMTKENKTQEKLVISKRELREMIRESLLQEQARNEEWAKQVRQVLEDVERYGNWPRLHKALADGSPNTKNLVVLAAGGLEHAAQKLRELAEQS